MSLIKKDFIFNDIKKLKGIGQQMSKYLKKRKIEKIKDILLNLPYSETDRSEVFNINKIEIGKVQTVKVLVKKLVFPRLRNLPNKIICQDETGEIDIVYFNSREGYLRKLFPVNKWVIISGKISFFKNKFQITNPDYATSLENQDYVTQNIKKYKLTKGINEKKYRSISEQVIKDLPEIDDWLDKNFIQKNHLLGWNDCINRLHKTSDGKDHNSNSFRRLVFDEICANLLTLSKNRKRIRIKKTKKYFEKKLSNEILNKLPFKLTNSQKQVLEEINNDLQNDKRMFRIIQGDVGSGKTIVSLLSAANVIENKYQCAFMGPTEILATQHYNLAKKIFKSKLKIEFLIR